jgi:hypothetical protein
MAELLSKQWFDELQNTIEDAISQSDIQLPDDEITLSQLITDHDGKDISYSIIMSKQGIHITFDIPDATTPALITDYETYVGLSAGAIEISQAIFSGKVHIRGDFQSLVKNRQLLQIIGDALTSI